MASNRRQGPIQWEPDTHRPIAPIWGGAQSCAVPTVSMARATPSDHSAGEKWEMCSALRAPIMAQRFGWLARLVMADARDDTSFGGINKPFQFSFTRSAAHPATLLTTTGKPQAMASFTTKPQGSV